MHDSEPNLTLEEAAALLCLTPDATMRLFEHEPGVTKSSIGGRLSLSIPRRTFAWVSSRLPGSVYTLEEIATALKVSKKTAKKMFEREKGVIVIGTPEMMHKRKYRTIRIPRAVYENVIRKLAIK